MLEEDIKKLREQLVFKFDNAESLELHWEAKAYSDCLNMLNAIFQKNNIST
jgi:hypothetical protein